MPKSEQEVKKFIEALEDAGYDPQPYSGRGMYGKHCVSLKHGPDDEPLSVWDLAKVSFNESYDGEFDNLPEPRQDSLGLGIVLYWPSYEWPFEKEGTA